MLSEACASCPMTILKEEFMREIASETFKPSQFKKQSSGQLEKLSPEEQTPSPQTLELQRILCLVILNSTDSFSASEGISKLISSREIIPPAEPIFDEVSYNPSDSQPPTMSTSELKMSKSYLFSLKKSNSELSTISFPL